MNKYYKFLSSNQTLFALFVALLLSLTHTSTAQTAITGANLKSSTAGVGSGYSASKAPGAASALSSSQNYTYSFGKNSGFTDNSKTVLSFTAGGSGYTYRDGETPVIKVRRVENAGFTTYYNNTGISRTNNPTLRDLAYFEGLVDNANSTVKIKSTYIPRVEDLFLTNDISIGIDNLFANTYATNFNNIERIDVITPSGRTIQSPGAEGFALFERGAYNAHDPVVVALITSVDANNTPLSYAAKVVRIATPDYYVTGQTTNTVYQPTNTATGNFIILRRDNAAGTLRASDLISANQGIGGVLIKYADFNIPAGTKVYGYSVLANDFPTNGTGPNVVDYTNATYFPTNSSDATMAAGNDMATITGVVKILTISGNVFHDANGLKDGLVNGPGINNPSGTQLYVNLVNAQGVVVGTTTVQPDGSFALDKLEFGSLTAQVTLNPGTLGQAAPAIALPDGWKNTGENYGLGNQAGTGSDSPDRGDGKISVSIGDENISQINFGIEKAPVADSYAYTISQNPKSGDVIALNGTFASNTTPLSELTGHDLEDANTPKGLNGDQSRTMVITTPISPSGTPITGGPEMWYNGQPISNYPVSPAGGYMIANYDADKLEVRITGTGYTGFSFSYAWIDNAGVQGEPASYKVSWLAPLPVRLVSFQAQVELQSVQLRWTTTEETNSSRFEIQRSSDAKNWINIGLKNAAGESKTSVSYHFTDETPEAGNNYYRLKMIDQDETFTWSKIVTATAEGQGSIVYPNPVTDKLNLQGLDLNAVKEVVLTDLNGRIVYQSQVTTTMVAAGQLVNVSGIAPGLHILKIVEKSGKVRTTKIVIRK